MNYVEELRKIAIDIEKNHCSRPCSECPIRYKGACIGTKVNELVLIFKKLESL